MVVGDSEGNEFPTTAGSFDVTNSGGGDAFLLKLSRDGSSLIFSTFLGGSGSGDGATSVAIDSSGKIYIYGGTNSNDFPTTDNAFDKTSNGGGDLFVAAFSSDGSTLLYSTYIGGSSHDIPRRIAIDSSGYIYITGYTQSSDFPTTNGAFDNTFNGGVFDAFVVKLKPDLSYLAYSTYFGGNDDDLGGDIAVDSSGNACIVGCTKSSDMPTTSGCYDDSFNGGDDDVFVAKFNSNGSDIIFSTYVGGNESDCGGGIALDSSDNIYVVGSTASSDFPVTNGAFDETHNGHEDCFIFKLSSDGSNLIYSTFLGGEYSDYAIAIALDSNENVYVTGMTNSRQFPVSNGAYNTTYHGDSNSEYGDVFVSKLDPQLSTLIYSTYIGGMDNDTPYSIAVDSSGNAYITGETLSPDFPVTDGAFDTEYHGAKDVFVTGLNRDGSNLIFSTYIGTKSVSYGKSIAMDSSGNIYVTGNTNSNSFPSYVSGSLFFYNYYDVFVTKLNPDGSSLIYSVFVGGKNDEYAHAMAIDSSGNVYVTGETKSQNFPTTDNAFDTNFNGTSGTSTDAFVFKLKSDGSDLVYSTFLGGSYYEKAVDIAVDSSGNAYVVGYTYSDDFPVTTGAFDTTFDLYISGFLTKLNSNGSDLVYSTFLGDGTNHSYTYCLGVDVNSSGNAYVCGMTNGPDFPTTNGSFDTSHHGNSFDGFVTKFSTDGSSLVYSTFLGGSSFDEANGIVVDSAGNAYVTGFTGSDDFPVTDGAFDTTLSYYDGFVTKLAPDGSSLIYSTYLGGSGFDALYRIAVNSTGEAFVTGYTESSDFPTTEGTFDSTYNGEHDALLTKLSADGSSLKFSTYIGGSKNDLGSDVVVDSSYHAYVVGTTASHDFPVSQNALEQSFFGSVDVFVAALNAYTYYKITATAGSGGSINPAGDVLVPQGGTKTFTITPDTGYHIKDVKVDGSSVGQVSTYTFTNVTSNTQLRHSLRSTDPLTLSLQLPGKAELLTQTVRLR